MPQSIHSADLLGGAPVVISWLPQNQHNTQVTYKGKESDLTSKEDIDTT